MNFSSHNILIWVGSTRKIAEKIRRKFARLSSSLSYEVTYSSYNARVTATSPFETGPYY